jgi:hypothetical protein
MIDNHKIHPNCPSSIRFHGEGGVDVKERGHGCALHDGLKVVLDEKGRDVYTVSPEMTAAEVASQEAS